MSRRALREIELEEENKILLSEKMELQDKYNNLIATNNNNNSLVFPTILTVVLFASAFNILSKQENFTVINLSLFVVPNIIELIKMPNQNRIINFFKWILMIFLSSIYFLLLSATFGNYIIDIGDAFVVPQDVLKFKGLTIYKENLSLFVISNVLVPFLSFAAGYKISDKSIADRAIQFHTAITLKGGKQNNV